ncbi:flagellin [Clostridium sp. LBM24168]
MRISYNMPALIMHRLQNKALGRQSANLLKISSGYKINSAKDNPSVLVRSENIRMQVGGLEAAAKNAQDGISMLQTAEGGLQEITSMIQRIRELTVQAGNGDTTEGDRKIIKNEIDQLLDGIDNMADSSEFNGLKLLSEEKTLEMPVGANPGETVKIPQVNLSKDADINGAGSRIAEIYSIKDNTDIVENADIDTALGAIDNSLNEVISIRSKYGALENRFESTYDCIQDISQRMVGADSDLRDADVAEEMMNYTKESIIVDASNAMIVQANELPQDVLRVLETVKR